MFRRAWIVLIPFLFLACGSGDATVPEDATETAVVDVATDVAPEPGTDAVPDVAVDAAPDLAPDIAPSEVLTDLPVEDEPTDAASSEPAADVLVDLPPETAAPLAAFAAPEGVAATADFVFVANTAFDGPTMSYGQGTLTVVSRSDFKVVNTIATSHKNPQVAAVVGGRLYVLCSGETSYDMATYVVSPKTAGALDIFDLATVATATAPTTIIELPLQAGTLVGYPSSLAVTADGATAFAGSGTAAAIYRVDVATSAVDLISLGDAATQDGLKVVSGAGGSLWVGSFNRDQVFLVDTVGKMATQTFDVGKTAEMEGVQDLAWRASGDPDLFVLMGLSSEVTATSSAKGQAGVQTSWAVTGLYPNRLVLAGERLLVVNSGDNNVTAFDPTTGASLGTLAVFPVKTNPYDLAVDGDLAFVTGLGTNTLFEVDLVARTVKRQVE